MNIILNDSSGVKSKLRPDVVIPCRLVTPFAHLIGKHKAV
jgi:hypothetical protein